MSRPKKIIAWFFGVAAVAVALGLLGVHYGFVQLNNELDSARIKLGITEKPELYEFPEHYLERVLPNRFPHGSDREDVERILSSAGFSLSGRSANDRVAVLRLRSIVLAPLAFEKVSIYLNFDPDGSLARMDVDNS